MATCTVDPAASSLRAWNICRSQNCSPSPRMTMDFTRSASRACIFRSHGSGSMAATVWPCFMSHQGTSRETPV